MKRSNQMELPGITKKRIDEFHPKLRAAIRRHIKEVKKIIGEKEKLLDREDPKEELLGLGGFKTIDKFIIKVEGPIEEKLLNLKQDMQELKEAIDREIILTTNLETLAKAGKKDKVLAEQLERMKEELADPLMHARIVLEQIDNIKTGHDSIVEILKTSKKQKEYGIAGYATRLDNLLSKLLNLIQTKETDALDVIYNLLQTPGWTELESELRV